MRILTKGEKISKAKKGIPCREETKRKISNTLKGRRLSIAHRNKISETLKGRKQSNEHRKNVSNSLKGKKLSEKHIQNIKKAAIKRSKNPGFLKERSESQKLKWKDINYQKYMTEVHKGQIPWNKGKPLAEEHKKKLSDSQRGKNCHAWKGGISKEPYAFEFDNELKESIKKRDDYKCQNPNCNNNSERLTVHHKNYNKKDFRDENLITLCNSCNSMANFNRDFWQSFYEEKLLCQ